MLATLFGKKKLTEEKLANVFVNSLVQSVMTSFGDVVDSIVSDPEFERTPKMNNDDFDKFLIITLCGNLSSLSRYFSNTEEMVLKGKIITKFAKVYGITYEEMNTIVKDYTEFIYRENYPSKNILYGMSKAVFHKYDLGQYQDEYFAQLNAPNPIFLKRMDGIMENYLWDWNAFLDKYKFSPVEQY
jgi:hypothetical protein